LNVPDGEMSDDSEPCLRIVDLSNVDSKDSARLLKKTFFLSNRMLKLCCAELHNSCYFVSTSTNYTAKPLLMNCIALKEMPVLI
jgi:hypothetical protein